MMICHVLSTRVSDNNLGGAVFHLRLFNPASDIQLLLVAAALLLEQQNKSPPGGGGAGAEGYTLDRMPVHQRADI